MDEMQQANIATKEMIRSELAKLAAAGKSKVEEDNVIQELAKKVVELKHGHELDEEDMEEWKGLKQKLKKSLEEQKQIKLSKRRTLPLAPNECGKFYKKLDKIFNETFEAASSNPAYVIDSSLKEVMQQLWVALRTAFSIKRATITDKDQPLYPNCVKASRGFGSFYINLELTVEHLSLLGRSLPSRVGSNKASGGVLGKRGLLLKSIEWLTKLRVPGREQAFFRLTIINGQEYFLPTSQAMNLVRAQYDI